jgi:hypothetical protein
MVLNERTITPGNPQISRSLHCSSGPRKNGIGNSSNEIRIDYLGIKLLEQDIVTHNSEK